MSWKSGLVVALLFLLIFVCEVYGNVLNPKDNSSIKVVWNGLVHSRRRKHRKNFRYLIPMIFAAVLLKSVLFPLAFKAMAMMSGISVFLSSLSLIVSSIVGYAKLAMRPSSGVKVHYDSLKKIDDVPNRSLISAEGYDRSDYKEFRRIGFT